MFDYLIKGVLQEQFQRFKRDTNSRSNDMIFIKELIYGGSLLGSEVPFYYKITFTMAINCTGGQTFMTIVAICMVYSFLHACV